MAAEPARTSIATRGVGGGAPTPLLSVSNLSVDLQGRSGVLPVVRGVDYELRERETLGMVGESGSGKTLSALALLGLHPAGVRYSATGSARYAGRELIGLDDDALSSIRGGSISMVFQDPMTSLNPVKRIGSQIAEAATLHLGLDEHGARSRARELLEMVGIAAAGDRLDDYPHQFSGGMRQRVMIAMALAGRPRILIADEPTTALDVTIQAQILELLAFLRDELGMAILLITHDLGVVAGLADRVVVMYAGRVMERGPVDAVLRSPDHPYTAALLSSLPRLDVPRSPRLQAIPGSPPGLEEIHPGCPFAPRCAFAIPRCTLEQPPLDRVALDHHSACLVHPFPPPHTFPGTNAPAR